ncbi:MAG TPA: hypothetical protein VLG28_11080 [Acidimicrobiia bacterium]|jgi:hypothetical protein|nr:hypothetical protein [Acidimicrobiia bacterium]
MELPRPLRALLAIVLLITVAPVATAVADHTTPPISVALPGSFNAALGCPGDWQPDCADVELDPDLLANGDGVWRGDFTTSAIPAGDYEAKIAINEIVGRELRRRRRAGWRQHPIYGSRRRHRHLCVRVGEQPSDHHGRGRRRWRSEDRRTAD